MAVVYHNIAYYRRTAQTNVKVLARKYVGYIVTCWLRRNIGGFTRDSNDCLARSCSATIEKPEVVVTKRRLTKETCLARNAPVLLLSYCVMT